MADLPRSTRVVIIGGGVIGCSVAYHLAKLGWSDVVLLERKQLTCGTTWHAAGLIGQLRPTANMTKLAKYSQELLAVLEAETGVATGFKQCGSMSLALTDERFEELRRSASMARSFGVEVEVISAAEARRLYPLVETGDVTGGIHIPGDGQADPTNIALAYAMGARANGVSIFEDVKVTDISTRDGRVTGVVTDRGPMAAEYVVNCAGMWGREIGNMVGVGLPLQACEHFYLVTEPVPDLDRKLPVLRVLDEHAYYKEDAGKLLLGAFEPVAKPWAVDGIPEDFCFDQLPDDFEHFAPILEMATKRMPVLDRIGIHTFFVGPESFTHDDQYLLGEVPTVGNFYVACGFNSQGILSSGGAGKALSEWLVGGEPPFDLWDVDVRRIFPHQATKSFISARVTETLGLLFADHFPHRQFATARGVRHTPFHEYFAVRGACFGETAGWERPHWFLPHEDLLRGGEPEWQYSWKRPPWFRHVAAEHGAVRSGAGVFDMSAFGKFRVEGPDAEAILQRLSANDVAVAPGRIVYTQWLNRHGGIEADLTITRLSETAYLVVTSAATTSRDFAWLRRNIPDDARCVAVDVSSAEACLAVMGPEAREVLQPLTPADLSNDAFPYATAQEIEIGMAPVRAHRISYAGELGWELFVATEYARHVLDAVGDADGLKLCGLIALESLRLEKGYRHFGHDISDEDHVLEAGLGFAVATDKSNGRFGDFIGREAVLAKREAGLTRRCLQFRLEDGEPLLYHTEPILRDGSLAGYLTSGAYGHHLGAAVGLGYVACQSEEEVDAILVSRFEIEIAGVRVPALASLKPLYDPAGARLRT
jgi:glycine cleavage system T protein